MYEHPIKRAGLTFNRILLSNTRMVAAAFPGAESGKYRLQYKLKFYEAGKEISRKYVNIKDVDEVFPARKWSHSHYNDSRWPSLSISEEKKNSRWIGSLQESIDVGKLEPSWERAEAYI